MSNQFDCEWNMFVLPSATVPFFRARRIPVPVWGGGAQSPLSSSASGSVDNAPPALGPDANLTLINVTSCALATDSSLLLIYLSRIYRCRRRTGTPDRRQSNNLARAPSTPSRGNGSVQSPPRRWRMSQVRSPTVATSSDPQHAIFTIFFILFRTEINKDNPSIVFNTDIS